MADKRLKAEPIISDIIDPGECNQVYRNLLEDRKFPMGILWDWTKC